MNPPPSDSTETSHDVGWTPIAEEATRAARLLHPDGSLPRPGRRRVMTVANQKGGVGKTTTTVNLAAALAVHGLKTLVIDLDPQGNASTALDVDHRSGTPSIYEVLIGEVTLAEAAQPTEQSPNLFCVPATIDLAGAEIELVSMASRESRLKEAISSESSTRSASTTSSSTARPRSACSRSTRWSPRRRCSSRSSASTTRWRVSASC